MSDRQVQMITLRGEQLRIVPSFAVLEKIEIATGKGVLQLLQELGRSQYKLSDIASIVYVAAQPLGDRLPSWWSRQEVGQQIVDDGMQDAILAVISALTDAVTAKSSIRLPKQLGDDNPKS